MTTPRSQRKNDDALAIRLAQAYENENPRAPRFTVTSVGRPWLAVAEVVHTEMEEAELRAARAVSEWVIDQYQRNREIQWIAVDDARLRAIIEKARREK